MIALMTLWFGPSAGFKPEAGYFYLCPSCYQACIAPQANLIMHRLTEHHPLGKKLRRVDPVTKDADDEPGAGAAEADAAIQH